MPTHVALLRGINVGGKNRLPMKDLVAMFDAEGARAVRTYVASGNVVFDATAAAAAKITRGVSARIAADFSLDVPLVLRSATELRQAAAANPFTPEEGMTEERLFVAFLADAPTKKAIASLAPDRSPPDRFIVRGRDVFLHLPNGAARTKITVAWLDARLGTTATVRNWNTIQKLDRLAHGER
jgi:uncharacterized protein (DUF1697 family)